jgi:hypothetical protein
MIPSYYIKTRKTMNDPKWIFKTKIYVQGLRLLDTSSSKDLGSVTWPCNPTSEGYSNWLLNSSSFSSPLGWSHTFKHLPFQSLKWFHYYHHFLSLPSLVFNGEEEDTVLELGAPCFGNKEVGPCYKSWIPGRWMHLTTLQIFHMPSYINFNCECSVGRL